MLHGRLSTTGPQAAEESMSRLPMFGDTLPTRA